LRSIRFRRRIGVLSTLSCACALVVAAAVDARSAAQARFHVTLNAQLTKTWNYVTAREEGDCSVSTRVEGTRKVVLASTRPTLATVTAGSRRVSFTPALVRSVRARITQDGAMTVSERGARCSRITRTNCVQRRRTVLNQTLRFYRSRPREISFRRSADYTIPTACPRETAAVRAERPGLHEAEGRLAERGLFARGVRYQTVSGGFEEETEISGDLEGKVVKRVTWNLKFTRR
jgi:hypothetical protein